MKGVQLTKRQYEILFLLGLTDDEIAARLGITRNTVNALTKKIYRKFNAHSRVQVVLRAIASGLVSPEFFVL